ncbi:hypothetical protein JCM10599A_24480 [Paraburkholderia kururiensis]
MVMSIVAACVPAAHAFGMHVRRESRQCVFNGPRSGAVGAIPHGNRIATSRNVSPYNEAGRTEGAGLRETRREWGDNAAKSRYAHRDEACAKHAARDENE